MVPRKPASDRPGKPPAASSSKITLDTIPAAHIPESLTPGYVYEPTERQPLTQEEQTRLIHELVGFNPKNLGADLTETARLEMYNAVTSIDNWTNTVAKDSKSRAELIHGLHALETLLETHVDKAFDMFTSWLLRNPFEFSPDLEVVLPWQKGLDFSRGEYVATQLGGQDGLQMKLDKLRTEVEQARLVSQRLEIAEEKLDRRIEALKQRQAQVGFVKEIIDSAGLNPLPTRAAQLQTTLTSLQSALTPLDIIPIPTSTGFPPSSGEHTKAWELGRTAYLNWALGKMLPPGERGGGVVGESGDAERLERIEQEIEEIGPRDGMEIITGSLRDNK
ncbi:kinetochore protein Mis12/MTW1 [Cryptococcus neoformans Tu259-1]|uniref:Kinetochore protein Mis12/MTW1 n=1 Tax=Cryptococcus neoformans Tu259-1 TaxID=1230072 RepID=A0A854Q8B8_CRYNE|nr:kinetochore protein Mis12/MTW1 [Cryptococcus neoformans var. grubii Tu259-1]